MFFNRIRHKLAGYTMCVCGGALFTLSYIAGGRVKTLQAQLEKLISSMCLVITFLNTHPILLQVIVLTFQS